MLQKIRAQRAAEAEYKDRYDLDQQLRNLEDIKRRREAADADRRDQAMRRRREYLTRVYFEEEMRKLQKKQGLNPNSYAFYTETGRDEMTRGYRTTFELRDKAAETSAIADPSQPRQFMIRPNNLEFFYEEKETSENVYLYHQRLNALWRLTTCFACVFAVWAFYATYRQKSEIWSAAGAVVVPKTTAKGAATRWNEDGSVEVALDGKVIDVITEANLSDNNGSESLQPTLRRAIAYAVAAKAQGKPLRDFYYYSKVIKPELKDLSPALYASYVGSKPAEHGLSRPPYGLTVRGNLAGQVEIARDPDSELSIFDTCCFNFYLVKYVELLGVEPLIAVLAEQRADEQGRSNSRRLSYNQKQRLVDFIRRNEEDLGVEESSWRHCLLFLFVEGAITQQ